MHKLFRVTGELCALVRINGDDYWHVIPYAELRMNHIASDYGPRLYCTRMMIHSNRARRRKRSGQVEILRKVAILARILECSPLTRGAMVLPDFHDVSHIYSPADRSAYAS